METADEEIGRVLGCPVGEILGERRRDNREFVEEAARLSEIGQSETGQISRFSRKVKRQAEIPLPTRGET